MEQCKQILRELSDTHIAAEWALNFLTFAASQVRRKGARQRRLSGMMSGSIEWNTASHSLPPFTSMLPHSQQHAPCSSNQEEAQHGVVREMHHKMSRDINTGRHGKQLLNEPVPPRPQATYQSSVDSSSQHTSLNYSPDNLTEVFNFPQSWLETSDSILAMDSSSWGHFEKRDWNPQDQDLLGYMLE